MPLILALDQGTTSSRAIVFDQDGAIKAVAADAITGQWKVDRRFEPTMAPAAASALRERWTAALERSKHWEKPGS